MADIVTEYSGSILRIELNRPAKKNAMTSSMYATMADLLDGAAKDDRTRVVLWHGAGDSFTAGNDLDDAAYRAAAVPARTRDAQPVRADESELGRRSR